MLQVGLADFQLVHPTETEEFVTRKMTEHFRKREDGFVEQVFEDEKGTRRKRIGINGAKVIVKGIRMVEQKEPQELVFPFDSGTGRALCWVIQGQLPQLPMDCDFEIYGPKGLIERGKVRCGGNEPVRMREVVLQGG